MNETAVKSETISYFKSKDYHTLPEFELDCRNKKFKVDVVAFKWNGEYDLETIAVECKGEVGLHTLIDAIYLQTREYQAGFSKVYPSVPENTHVPEDILESYGIGLLEVGSSVKEKKTPDTDKSAPKLDHQISGYAVRQKLVAYMTLEELMSGNKNRLKSEHVNNFGFVCWIDEFCNYCIQNDIFLNRDYYLSIILERSENVMRALKSLKANKQEFLNLLKNLPENFIFSVYQVFVAGRKLRSYGPVLKLPISSVDENLLNWVIGFAQKTNYKTCICIGGKLWGIDDFLSKNEHLGRAKEVLKHLEPIKKFLYNY